MPLLCTAAALVVSAAIAFVVVVSGASDTGASDTRAASTDQPVAVDPASPADSPAPRSSAPPTAAAAPPPAGGWVPVDAAEQAKRKAAFSARTPAPVTGNPVTGPEFHATCTVSHHAKDDPIVFPGLVGASHHHTFLGNRTTDACSTTASLTAATTMSCEPAGDLSA